MLPQHQNAVNLNSVENGYMHHNELECFVNIKTELTHWQTNSWKSQGKQPVGIWAADKGTD
jgi:hypothetical protein